MHDGTPLNSPKKIEPRLHRSASHDPVGDGRQQVALLLIALAAYIDLNFMFRWMRWPLFHGAGAYGWVPLPFYVVFYQDYIMTFLPIAFWSFLVYCVARRYPNLFT